MLTHRIILLSFVLWFQSLATAGLVRVEVKERVPFAGGISYGRTGAYELIEGRLFLEVDPKDPANARITDIGLAPTNEQGQVEYWTDFTLLIPQDPSKGNGSLLYDVHNRGNKLALWTFNDALRSNMPRDKDHGGNGFLMREGYSVLWTGWSGEIQDDGMDRLLGGIPVAVNQDGSPVTGRAHVEILVDEKVKSRDFFASRWGISAAYPTVSMDQSDATLTKRPNRQSPAEEIDRADWAFARWENGKAVPDPTSLYVKDGFEPGWVYDLVYTARDPRVSGLGLAGLRDTISFLRYEKELADGTANPLYGTLKSTVLFGISQSGRFCHQFLYDGFNLDPEGRRVFEGALIHVPGAGKGLFNHRFGMATVYGGVREGNLSPIDEFPLTPVKQVDPVTGQEGDSFARLREGDGVPKTMFVQSSTEYWARAASLLHTDVEGKKDIELDENTRLYLISSSQHLDGSDDITPPIPCQYELNPIKHRGPVLRALLVALDQWILDGAEPPASQYPRLKDGTLVDLETLRAGFPKLAEFTAPEQVYTPVRLDSGPRWVSEGIADVVPPKQGKAFVTLLPAVDADGNEIAGIRLPEVAVALGTATGWNIRAQAYGDGGVLVGLHGAWFPFAKTKAERETKNDPRLSLEERYVDRENYLGKVGETLLTLREGGYLLDEDVTRLLDRAAAVKW